MASAPVALNACAQLTVPVPKASAKRQDARGKTQEASGKRQEQVAALKRAGGTCSGARVQNFPNCPQRFYITVYKF